MGRPISYSPFPNRRPNGDRAWRGSACGEMHSSRRSPYGPCDARGLWVLRVAILLARSTLAAGKGHCTESSRGKRAPTCAESVILFQEGRTMLPSPLSDSILRRPRSGAPLASATIFPPSLPRGPCIVCEICGAVRSPHHEFRDCRLRFGRISRAEEWRRERLDPI